MLGELGLAGEVVAERAEVAAHDTRLREHFATGTARAVASAPTVAELLLPFIAVGGSALLATRHDRRARAPCAQRCGADARRSRSRAKCRSKASVASSWCGKSGPTPSAFPTPHRRPGETPALLVGAGSA